MTAFNNDPNAFNTFRAAYTLAAATPEHPNLRCTLRVSPRFTAKLPDFCPLHPDAAAYAARRLLCQDRALQDWLVPISYGLRLAKGRGRRARTLWLRAHAVYFAMELRQAAVYVRLTVDAEGVTVDRVEVAPYQPVIPAWVDAWQPAGGDIPLLVAR